MVTGTIVRWSAPNHGLGTLFTLFTAGMARRSLRLTRPPHPVPDEADFVTAARFRGGLERMDDDGETRRSKRAAAPMAALREDPGLCRT